MTTVTKEVDYRELQSMSSDEICEMCDAHSVVKVWGYDNNPIAYLVSPNMWYAIQHMETAVRKATGREASE